MTTSPTKVPFGVISVFLHFVALGLRERRHSTVEQSVPGSIKKWGVLPFWIEKHLQSVKWNPWHGNVPHAVQKIAEMEDDLAMLEKNPANKKKLQKAVKEMFGYISANKNFIPNYGDRYRHKETISTAFVESTVNYVVSKRFVKKQQMRWTQRGAHLLLQTRVQVLNGDLRNSFCRWFPTMKSDETNSIKAAA